MCNPNVKVKIRIFGLPQIYLNILHIKYINMYIIHSYYIIVIFLIYFNTDTQSTRHRMKIQ